jgi:hypothetical protein
MANFEQVNADFGPDKNSEVREYVHQHLDDLVSSHNDLHTNKLPKWRKSYLGRPAEESRNFPFPNAANTVVQVIGETVDTMVARVMGIIWATHPLWAFKCYEKAEDIEKQKGYEIERRALEDFMDVMGVEPSELNLHEVEAIWYTEAANLGTAFVKLNLENQVEAVVTGYTESRESMRGIDTTIYEGPKVSNLRHEDIVSDPRHSLEQSNFVAVKRTLSRFQLEERGYLELYEKEAVQKLLDLPDRSLPNQIQREELALQGVQPRAYTDHTAEWDVWECYFPYWHKGRKYRIIYTYHRKSKTKLRSVFNFLPQNGLPVKRAKLGYRTPGLYGHGYAELLEIYQEELSTVHNQRLDNATVANIRALRISPRARALDSNTELYPAALIVAEEGEIESIQVGDVYPSTFKNEELTLQLVARRAGITPAVAGGGSGGMKGKAGSQQYTAQGTLAVMQENNSVVGFATSEFRHAHAQLGTMLVKMYDKFGTAGKEEMFGLDGEKLKNALAKFGGDQGINIPLRSTTASLNREVDKQTGVIIAGLLQRHYTAVGQLIQAINNPMAPPEFKEYAAKVVIASEQFHKKVVKDFGYEQPDLYIPEAQSKSEGANPQGPMAPSGSPVAGNSPAPPGGHEGMAQVPSMGSVGSGIGPVTK